jgi:hypothetical protein
MIAVHMLATLGPSLTNFEAYVTELRSLLREPTVNTGDPRLIAALDGEPSRRLRQTVEADLLRSTGTFFTGATLSKRILAGIKFSRTHQAVDPACGVGDLLLALVRTLPVASTFEDTVSLWSRSIAGCDIHREFVTATKLRLALVALERGVRPPGKTLQQLGLFPSVVLGDGMSYCPDSHPDLVVMNPPYTRVLAPPDCHWAEGNVSGAALFVDRWLEQIAPGGRMIAILPDVLRSGSNYRAWREAVLKRANINWLDILGRFDASADVDVFAVELVAGSSSSHSKPWRYPRRTHKSTIGTRFDVHVGSIVPHRDRKIGKHRAYLNAKTAEPWGLCRRINGKLRTMRTLFEPPLVVIRRTSSPSDPHRAIATIVVGNRRVAVENHLLVLIPRKGGLPECRRLVSILKSPRTTSWLNKRIRCRHLTVDSVKEIPWWED